ncbi:hypothetical protein K8O96_10695 [Clostridium sporogenes]|uniref:Uncharacterized protein n=1 Tax=Clostridium botulinum TaxID=1491 RepID=A0A6M0T3T4_CLOBO|nr:hypothetical protein [Clostridium sporogenes]NFA62033.1 hypothetical protein [Clostridium botulinum]NFI75486.1 hypothetical protein [Clostridium sporogenes]NFL73474.1 hypothetical protein [Clostridium sporogenes]NFM25878.1 hypothetical protein [Clostridium sporogenes]NFP63590.1 hypothetical protein [Clostridium sporogenes]
MKPVIDIDSNIIKNYNKNNFIFRIKDELLTHFKGNYFIEELNLVISKVNISPNFNEKAYHKNIKRSIKYSRHKDFVLAPNTFRFLDYYVLNSFQKELFALSVCESIKTVLRLKGKSMRNSCIVIFDAKEEYVFNIINYVSKEAKYIILVSEDLNKLAKLSDYIIANYGITPIITRDIKASFSKSDFIITTKDVEIIKEIPVWYINNSKIYKSKGNCNINGITYKVPWKINLNFNPELLGAILCQMDKKNVEEAIRYNGIVLDKIMFNEEIIKITR